MKAIGIDIGTTSVCGVVLDAKTGEVINSYAGYGTVCFYLIYQNQWISKAVR